MSDQPQSAPVCGATTRAGTQCQNTLVTGCGRCPVHASQARAAAAGIAPRTRVRKKRKKKEGLSDQTSDALHNSIFATPRPPPSAPSFAFDDVNVPQPFHDVEFATPLQGAGGVGKEALGIEASMKQETAEVLGTPVTPGLGDQTGERFDYIYAGGSSVKEDDIAGMDVLQTDEEPGYLDAQLKVNFDELCGDL